MQQGQMRKVVRRLDGQLPEVARLLDAVVGALEDGGRLGGMMSGPVKRAAGYLRRHSTEDIADDVRDAVRARPGVFLLGALMTGYVADREDAIIRISESHADFFVRNLVVILAEERSTLVIERPTAIITGALFHQA